MTMIDKQKLLEWLYEERCNAQRQLDVREVGDSNWYEYRGRTTAFNYVIYYVNSMPDAEPRQAEPKFRVGDRVKAVSGQYTGKSGILTHFNKDDPDFCRVRYDDHESEADELTDWIELIEDEPLPAEPKFKIGDRVKSVRNNKEGKMGTVVRFEGRGLINGRIEVKFEDGDESWKLPENLELIEDEPLPETPRFKVGDRVRSIDGLFLGEIATVTKETTGTSTRVKFDNGTKIYRNTDYLELLQARPTVKITGAEAFVESAKQLIKALEAVEVKIDERDNDTD